MAKNLYSQPIVFSLVATFVILIGTVATMFFPMFTEGMHPQLDALEPYTPLQLAGRDVYQAEGCNNCHTQTVRPLKTEVMRYGEYSKAGEFAFDRPFLWGSKRTGPDLARIGRKYPDAWHDRHYRDPQSFFEKSNMPSYEWLAEAPVRPAVVKDRMDALGFPYTDEQIQELGEKSLLDALIAYTQVIGTAVKVARADDAAPVDTGLDLEAVNPLGLDPAAIDSGRQVFSDYCADCHGEQGEGDIGPALDDLAFLGVDGDVPDGYYFYIVHEGSENGFPLEGFIVEEEAMPPYSSDLTQEEIWSVVSFMRSLQLAGR